MPKQPKPKQQRGETCSPQRGRRYSEDEKKAALAALLANNGNLSKTSKQTGISRDKLREWQSSDVSRSPEIATLKKELVESYREKLKKAREAGLDRMLQLIPEERDLHKVTGAVKVLSELNITEEVADDLTRPTASITATDGTTAHANEGAALTRTSFN